MQTARQRADRGNAQSISDALSLLNEVADSSSNEIKEMVAHDYRKLKKVFSDARPEFESASNELRSAATQSIRDARDAAVRRIREAGDTVNQSVHEKPWGYVAGTAVATGLLGFFLGRKVNSGSRH